MNLLITPNGFPMACTRDEYDTAVKEVEMIVKVTQDSDEITFGKQLELLTVFTKVLKDVGNIFLPLVSNPTLPVSPTVVSFLTAIADDVNKTTSLASYKSPARNITIWSNLFSLEQTEESMVPASAKSLEVLKQASIVQSHDILTALSKTRPISEIVDIMKIIFGDLGHV